MRNLQNLSNNPGSGGTDIENYEIVQCNKETGEEKLFMHDVRWNTSKETAEAGAYIRRKLCSDKYEVFIRQIEPV